MRRSSSVRRNTRRNRSVKRNTRRNRSVKRNNRRSNRRITRRNNNQRRVNRRSSRKRVSRKNSRRRVSRRRDSKRKKSNKRSSSRKVTKQYGGDGLTSDEILKTLMTGVPPWSEDQEFPLSGHLPIIVFGFNVENGPWKSVYTSQNITDYEEDIMAAMDGVIYSELVQYINDNWTRVSRYSKGFGGFLEDSEEFHLFTHLLNLGYSLDQINAIRTNEEFKEVLCPKVINITEEGVEGTFPSTLADFVDFSPHQQQEMIKTTTGIGGPATTKGSYLSK